MNKVEQVLELIKQARSGGVSYSCAMLYFEDADSNALKHWNEDMKTLNIKDEDLHDHGIEEDPHVTILYGLHTGSAAKVKKALKENDRTVMTCRLGKLDLFENAEFDVLIRKVERKDHLSEVRKVLTDNLEATIKYKDYKPHATIAYLKKGKGKEYLNKYKDTKWKLNHEFDCDVIDFSNKGKKHTKINLGEVKKAGAGSAPNYGPAEDAASSCSKCAHAQSGYCTLYDFDFESGYTCDSFTPDITAQTSEGVPEVMAKYLPAKIAQYMSSLQFPTTAPTGAQTNMTMPGQAMSSEQLSSNFNNIAQQGKQNGAAIASGVQAAGQPGQPGQNNINANAMPYGVNAMNTPYGVNAMPQVPEQQPQQQQGGQQQQQPAQPKQAQALPANAPYSANPIRVTQQTPQQQWDQHHASFGNVRNVMNRAAVNRYGVLQQRAQADQARRMMAEAQRQAQMHHYAQKQAYAAGVMAKFAEYGLDLNYRTGKE